MRRLFATWLLCAVCLVVVAGCDVPTPPPELPTATPGSANPESLNAVKPSPFVPTPVRDFSPLKIGTGHIYFVRDDHLWRVNPDKSGEMQLSDMSVSNPPQPSPDGKWVAFTSSDGVYVVPAEGGAARKIGAGQIADYQRLGWSPDSTLVGYIALDPDVPGDENGWAAPLDGSVLTKIATLTQGASRGPVYERAVLWSPDYKWVVVAGVNNPMKLMRWPLSQGNPGDERDIAGGEPDWSPDSRALFYSQTLSGALSLYEILEADSTPYANEANFDGTGMGEYAQGPGPRISPAATGNDSDPIAYRSHTGSGEPRVSIRRRGRRELAALPGLTNNPSWSPNGDMLVVESGTVQEDSLGPKWVPTGLGIAQLNMTGEHTYTPLLENAKWPAWGK